MDGSNATVQPRIYASGSHFQPCTLRKKKALLQTIFVVVVYVGGIENSHQRFDGVFALARCFKAS